MRRGSFVALGVFVAAASVARDASALDLPKLFKKPLSLEVTEVTIVAQRFARRENQAPEDFGWGQWINRINATLSWDKITAGVRLDSAAYWNRPIDQFAYWQQNDPGRFAALQEDNTRRFRDSIYPAKLWISYNAPGLEITVGDAYVQFARGLVLSMRKLDDIGIDTTVRGAKVSVQKGPFGLTFVGGYANPSRLEEASGQAIFLPTSNPNQPRSPFPVFGSDHILGGELQAGRGTPVVLSTSIANVTRCAPYKYLPSGKIDDAGGSLAAEIGHCDDDSVNAWLAGINPSRTRSARYVTNASESIEFPRIGSLGSLYIAGVVQQRTFVDTSLNDQGNALLLSYSGSYGPVTNTFEIKSYRNFYGVDAGIDTLHLSAFSPVKYSQPPTAELITQDNLYGDFNVCVDGGRLRTDLRMSPRLLTYFQAIYAHSKTEQGATCDRMGHIQAPAGHPADFYTNDVWDGLGGIQFTFDRDQSYLYATIGTRNDHKGTGEPFYHQSEITYTFSKYLGKSVSLELLGRHRMRWEEATNTRGPGGQEENWAEGENYTALKIAPKWVFSQGLEYTTKLGLPTFYVNGGILYKFTKDSNLKVLVGQQRGGLRCVSGVCRQFPAFEGARMELTVRF